VGGRNIGLKRLHRAQATLHQERQLVVKTEARNEVRHAHIGARQESHASTVHLTDQPEYSPITRRL
jgi:hypothetical protein